MKVVFIYLDMATRAEGKLHLGIASLSAVLKKAGHSVGLIHIFEPMSREEFRSRLAAEGPDLLAFSCTSFMWAPVLHYARMAKEFMDVLSICGGIHPTLNPEEVMAERAFDALCIGEGERPLLELCRRMERGEDITTIPGLWVRADGGVKRNPPGTLISDLDSLPDPDRTIFDYPRLQDAKYKRALFMSGRGCPYNCSYCINESLREVQGGRYVRLKSVPKLMGEIAAFREQQPFEHIEFADDIFGLGRKWLAEFCSAYRREIGIPFRCSSRADLIDRGMLTMLKEAGCFKLSIGIESGNDFIRQEVMGRRITQEQILSAFRLCREVGIETFAFYMVGFPFEDMRRALDTAKMHARVWPDSKQISILYPYPGTRVYDLCLEHGFITERMHQREVTSYFDDTVLELPTITRPQILFIARHFGFLARLYRYGGFRVEGLLDRALSSGSFARLLALRYGSVRPSPGNLKNLPALSAHMPPAAAADPRDSMAGKS